MCPPLRDNRLISSFNASISCACSCEYKHTKSAYQLMDMDYGNLKGESVVAVILPSCMEVSYYTSRFFRS